MSDIFNLTKLSETNTRVNSLMNTQITRENSMISMVGNLTKLNESLSEDLKTMYRSIAEASDKEEENTIFCQYFADISKKLNKRTKQLLDLLSLWITSQMQMLILYLVMI